MAHTPKISQYVLAPLKYFNMSRAGAILKSMLKLRVLTLSFTSRPDGRVGLQKKMVTTFFLSLSAGFAANDKKKVVTFFLRSTPPSGRDLILSVPTLSKNLFWGINQTNDKNVLHLSLLYPYFI